MKTKRNGIAKALGTRMFRQRIVRSKKVYTRKNQRDAKKVVDSRFGEG